MRLMHEFVCGGNLDSFPGWDVAWEQDYTSHILRTFPHSMQHYLAFPVCARSPKDWEGRLGPLQDREFFLQ